jgi:hypothetical protein
VAPIAGRTRMAAVWTGDQLFVWGGYDRMDDGGGTVTADGALYDPTTSTWRRLPASPLSAQAGAQAIWLNGQVLVLGGQPAVVSGTQYEYRDMAAYDPATDRWTKLPSMPIAKDHSLLNVVAVAVTDHLYAWQEWQRVEPTADGGSTTYSGVDLDIYDPARNTWTADVAASRPSDGSDSNNAPQGIVSAIAIGRDVFVPAAQPWCGGCPGPWVPGQQGRLLNVAMNTWTKLPHGPVDDLGPTSLWTGSALVAVDTGSSTSGPDGTHLPGEVAAWDPTSNSWVSLPAAPLASGGRAVAVWAGDRVLEWGPMFVPSDAGAGAPAERDAGLSFGP